jgi:hypothetical protein
MSAVGVATAQAAEGPKWTVEIGGVKKTLAKAETRSVASIKNLSTTFKLKTSTATIVCTSVRLGTTGGTLAGGNPGTDKVEIVFSGCTVEGHSSCKAEEGSTGKIISKVITMLGYEKPKSENMALDGFFPEKSNEVFAEFSLVGPAEECPKVTGNIVVKPTATNTAVNIPELGTRRCGVLAQVGKSSGTVFALTSNGELFAKGGLNFPATAITVGEHWNGSAFAELKCSLSAGVLGAATEIGESEITLEAGITAFGWTP